MFSGTALTRSLKQNLQVVIEGELILVRREVYAFPVLRSVPHSFKSFPKATYNFQHSLIKDLSLRGVRNIPNLKDDFLHSNLFLPAPNLGDPSEKQSQTKK